MSRRAAPNAPLTLTLSTLLPLLCVGIPGIASADEPDVLSVRAQCRPDPKKEQSLCRFAVTIRHADDGWKHYTRHFQLVQPNGQVLVTRFLKHPHAKQPFTRTITAVPIPFDIEWLDVRAGDLEHERGETFRLDIPHKRRPSAADAAATDAPAKDAPAKEAPAQNAGAE